LFKPVNAGIGDRLRGLVLAYHLAQILGRTFLAAEVSDNGAKFALQGRNITDLVEWRHVCSNCRDSLAEVDFGELDRYPVITIQSNQNSLKELHDNPSLRGRPGYPAFLRGLGRGTLFHEPLLRVLGPTENVTQALEHLLEIHPLKGHFTVGIHFRTTDAHLRGKRGSRTHPTRIPAFVGKVMEVWGSLPEKKRAAFPLGLQVFIATDSPKALEAFATSFQELGVPWFDASEVAPPPTHTSHGGDQTRTFVDWFFLSKVQLLIASRSGFSETAARRGCVNIIVARYRRFFEFTRGRGLCTPETDLQWLIGASK
jgi:hypothetical protein